MKTKVTIKMVSIEAENVDPKIAGELLAEIIGAIAGATVKEAQRIERPKKAKE